MTKKNLLSATCSDWHLRWSGTLGKLTLNPLSNDYTWKGYWQGRHGQTASRGSHCTFTVNDGKINFTEEHGCRPVDSELLKAVDQIQRQQLYS